MSNRTDYSKARTRQIKVAAWGEAVACEVCGTTKRKCVAFVVLEMRTSFVQDAYGDALRDIQEHVKGKLRIGFRICSACAKRLVSRVDSCLSGDTK